MNFWQQLWAVTWKDLFTELRSKDALNASVAFTLVILLLFSFAFDPTAEETKAIAGGLLWLVFAFAGALILNRSFTRELPNDCLDALLVAPVPAGTVLLGKVIANWCLLMLVELLALPIFIIFYNVRWDIALWAFLLTLALGNWALSVVGTVFSALTVRLRLRELMLPVLLYPIVIPALLAAVQLSSGIVAGVPLNDQAYAWLRLLVGFDIIFSALAILVIEQALIG